MNSFIIIIIGNIRYVNRKDIKMSSPKANKKRKLLVWSISALALIAVVLGAAFIYVNDYYRADTEAIASVRADGVTKKEIDESTIVYSPENATAGFIFYPGGKVEFTAYEPLMTACAEKGILCVLKRMPFNLAVLDVNAADGIAEQFPEIEHWYIGGHSLGGSMAAAYAEKHADVFDGLILLGSYSASDLSETELEVLSVYGSEDGVLNRQKYEESIPNLPDGYTEFVIDGGCHAFFGMYGAQDGDGIPSITCEDQIGITAEKIAEFVAK